MTVRFENEMTAIREWIDRHIERFRSSPKASRELEFVLQSLGETEPSFEYPRSPEDAEAWLEQEWSKWRDDPARAKSSSLYHVTHAVFYATRQGTRRLSWSEERQALLGRALSSIAVTRLAAKHYDLGAELLLAASWAGLPCDGIEVLEDVVQRHGCVPTDERSAPETDDEFTNCYHATLVTLALFASRHAAAVLDEAATELARLIALPDQPDWRVVTTLFGDPVRTRDLWRRRSGKELRELLGNTAFDTAPPARELAVRSAIEFWRWARAGFGVVDAVTFAQRMETCAGCEHYVNAPPRLIYALAKQATGGTKICGLCGCFMAKKARQASSECPLERWSAAS
jgi:hypothetical protein